MTELGNPVVPIGMDRQRIEAAMRRLVTIAIEEDLLIAGPGGAWPTNWPDTPVGRLISHPVAEACRMGYQTLLAHLGSLIGAREAGAVGGRICFEVKAAIAPNHQEPPAPSEVRH